MDTIWSYTLPLEKAEELFKYTIAQSSNARVRHVFENYSVEDFLRFTKEEFKSFRNIGDSAHYELLKIQDYMLQYVSNNEDWHDPKEVIVYKYDLSSLSEIKRNAISNRFKELIAKSNNKIKKAFSHYDPEEFLNIKDFKDVRNIGKNTCPELKEIQEELIRNLEDITKLSDESCVLLEIYDVYGISDDFLTSFLGKNHRVPMFWIMEQYYKKNIDEKKWDIFVSRYKITKPYVQMTLEELAKRHGLTSRERIRQLEKYFPSDFYDFPHRQPDWTWYINNTMLDKRGFMSSDMLSDILIQENCDFFPEFALELLYWIFNEKYMYVGGLVEENDKSKWNIKLLVDKRIIDTYDLEAFYRTCKDLTETNDFECTKDINDLVQDSRFILKEVSNEVKENLFDLLKYILESAFGLEVNGTKAVFPAVKERKLYKYLKDILQEAQRPMHITELSNKLKELLPEKHYEESQIRSCVGTYDCFSYQSRNSTYTLREWENVFSGTKGDAMEQFLKMNDCPQNLDEIKKYIDKCFPNSISAKNSLRTIMKVDPQKRFVKYNSGLYGINGKVYSEEYTVSPEDARNTMSFDEKLDAIEKFIQKYGNLPSFASENKDDIALRRWWYINTVRNYSKLTDERKQKIEQIRRKFNV